MKIVKFIAENIKRLKVVEITPNGNVVEICGKNDQGKSSVLDAIAWALGGQALIDAVPIRLGEEEAYSRVTLDSGIVVERTWNHSGSKLKV